MTFDYKEISFDIFQSLHNYQRFSNQNDCSLHNVLRINDNDIYIKYISIYSVEEKLKNENFKDWECSNHSERA